MECIQCGATLRPGARFCNTCGTAQPVTPPSPVAGDQPPALVKRPPRPVRAEDEEADADADEREDETETQTSAPIEAQAAVAEHERMAGNVTIPGRTLDEPQDGGPAETPTPPAVAAPSEPFMPPLAEVAAPHAVEVTPLSPHADNGLDQPAEQAILQDRASAITEPAASAEGVAAAEAPAIDEALVPASPSPPELEAAPAAPVEPAGDGAVAEFSAPAELSASATPAAPAAPVVRDEPAETAASPEPAKAAEPAEPSDAGEPVAATTDPTLEVTLPLQEVATEPPAERPWPLPAGFLVAGRYRVESVLTAAPEADDSPDAENVYLATDTRGYLRCWSCGAEHGEAAAGERFCPRCGADMLARELTLTEHRLAAPDDLATAPPPPAGAELRFLDAGREYRVALRVTEAVAFPAGPALVVGAATDVGRSRQARSAQNEDSFGVTLLTLSADSHRRTLGLLAVADGLGGHVSGQDASRTTIRALAGAVLRTLGLPLLGADSNSPDGARASGDVAPMPEDLQRALLDGARAANEALLAANAAAGADSGSTLVAALVWDDTAYIVNAGDSRAYVFADGALTRLTIDHSLIEGLIAGGLVAPEDRYSHPQRNQIIRSLGDDPELRFDLFEQRLAPGLRLLLCSDGLWEMVRDPDLARILAEAPHPQAAADALVLAANENGGEDNITALVVEVRA